MLWGDGETLTGISIDAYYLYCKWMVMVQAGFSHSSIPNLTHSLLCPSFFHSIAKKMGWVRLGTRLSNSFIAPYLGYRAVLASHIGICSSLRAL